MTPQQRLQEAKDQAAREMARGNTWSDFRHYISMSHDDEESVYNRFGEIMYEAGKKEGEEQEKTRIEIEHRIKRSEHLQSGYSASDAKDDKEDYNFKQDFEKAKDRAAQEADYIDWNHIEWNICDMDEMYLEAAKIMAADAYNKAESEADELVCSLSDRINDMEKVSMHSSKLALKHEMKAETYRKALEEINELSSCRPNNGDISAISHTALNSKP